MKFLCAILAICGVAYIICDFQNLAGKLGLADKLGSVQKVLNQPFATAPVDQHAAIRTLSKKILGPLESTEPNSSADAAKSLAELRAGLAGSQSPTASRDSAALDLLQQALAERQTFLKTASTGGSSNPLDKVPGTWHVVGDKTQVVNRAAVSQHQRSSYWAQVAKAQWQQRAQYYAQKIAPLLSPAS